MRKRLMELKKDQKGFTLVELIVVLVILAILAALLVPALLGYIDRARSSKYLEEARSIYTAIQAVQDEKYAKAAAPMANLTNADDLKEVNALVTPTQVTSVTIGALDATDHGKYVVSTLTSLIFVSQDKNTITVDMKADGSWDTDNMKVQGPSGS